MGRGRGRPVQSGTELALGPGTPSPELMAYRRNPCSLSKTSVPCAEEDKSGSGIGTGLVCGSQGADWPASALAQGWEDGCAFPELHSVVPTGAQLLGYRWGV